LTTSTAKKVEKNYVDLAVPQKTFVRGKISCENVVSFLITQDDILFGILERWRRGRGWRLLM
jgi:hypothetical protein